MKIIRILLFLCTLIPSTLCADSKHIIFGITDVLIKPSMKGVRGAAIAKMTGFTIKRVRTMLFEKLRTLHSSQFQKSDSDNPPVIAYWLTTPNSSSYALRMAMAHIKSNSSFIKKKILKIAVQSTFTPSEAVAVLQANSQMQTVFNQCKSSGHTLYACDNMNKELFSVLKPRHASIFNQCAGLHISGECGYLMSEQQFYKKILSTHKMKAADCYFISNNSLALSAARACGMHAIYYDGRSNTAVLNSLRSFGLLS